MSCALVSIPLTPTGLGDDIIIMSSCYSSLAPHIIVHASSYIHSSVLQPPSYQPSPHIPHIHTHTHNNELYIWSIHLLDQVTPLSPTPQSRSTQHTHNNQLLYSHPLALDRISSMHYHLISCHPSTSLTKSPRCHQPPSPDPHNTHTTMN